MGIKTMQRSMPTDSNSFGTTRRSASQSAHTATSRGIRKPVFTSSTTMIVYRGVFGLWLSLPELLFVIISSFHQKSYRAVEGLVTKTCRFLINGLRETAASA